MAWSSQTMMSTGFLILSWNLENNYLRRGDTFSNYSSHSPLGKSLIYLPAYFDQVSFCSGLSFYVLLHKPFCLLYSFVVDQLRLTSHSDSNKLFNLQSTHL